MKFEKCRRFPISKIFHLLIFFVLLSIISWLPKVSSGIDLKSKSSSKSDDEGSVSLAMPSGWDDSILEKINKGEDVRRTIAVLDFEGMVHPTNMALYYYYLGDIQRLLGDYTQSEKYFRKVFEISAQFQDPDFHRKIYDYLGKEPLHIEQIIAVANLTPGNINAGLISLRLKGLIKQLPGSLFLKN